MRNRLNFCPIWSVESKVVSTIVLGIATACFHADGVGCIWLHGRLQLLFHVPAVQEKHVYSDRHVMLTLVIQTLTTACVCRSARGATSGSTS